MQNPERVAEVAGVVSEAHVAYVLKVELHIRLVCKDLTRYVECCLARIYTVQATDPGSE